MADLKVNVGDKTDSQDSLGGQPVDRAPERKAYVVIAEAMLKNGVTYKRGDTVELDAKTAASAIAAGDVKESKS